MLEDIDDSGPMSRLLMQQMCACVFMCYSEDTFTGTLIRHFSWHSELRRVI